MTALLIVVAAIVLLFIGYVFYGSWLANSGVSILPRRLLQLRRKMVWITLQLSLPYLWVIIFIYRRSRPDQRTDSGFHLRMGSRIPVVYHRWYFLRRSAGLRIFIRIYQT